MIPLKKKRAGDAPAPSVFDSDSPPDSLTPETDAFGHSDYAEAIASALREAKAPFTLGLYGPWGVGKTTLIKHTGTLLASDCAFVAFDAWRYDGDTLRRQFLRELAHQLHESGELDGDYKLEKELLALDVDVSGESKEGEWGLNRNELLRAVLGLISLAVLIALLTWQTDDTRQLVWKYLAAFIALGVALLMPALRMVEVTRKTEVRRRLVEPELFTQKFEDLLASVKRKRLVVAIDNLDRCNPERVTELLETLNTYLEPAGTPGEERSEKLRERRVKGRPIDAIFLVAADDDALRRHVESQEAKLSDGYTTNRDDVGRYADEYLRKIFKATIPIKPVLDSDIRGYVEGKLQLFCDVRKVEEEHRRQLTEVIAGGLRRNPRRVGQFVKNLELRLRLLDERFASKQIAAELRAYSGRQGPGPR